MRPATGYYSPSDNFVATLGFADGSLATLTYTAAGSREYPKEQMEVFVDGKVIAVDDYRRLTVSGSKRDGLATPRAQKGQKEELQSLAQAILGEQKWPIPLWQQLQATDIALQVEGFLARGQERE
jgi:predicted dehydrogenase